jgi:excisionase family DNA binding protein
MKHQSNGSRDPEDAARAAIGGAGESIGGGVIGPDRLMTIDEVAAYTQLSKNTLYKMRSKGHGPRAARLGKHLRYRRTDVDAWITAQLDDWPSQELPRRLVL